MPAWLLPAIGMATQAASNIWSNIFGKNSVDEQNRKSREWSEMMYNRQRQDSLSDWSMQNEYNSPKEQMKRFRDANLNPNLIYGQMSPTTAGVPRSANVEAAKFEAYKPDLSGFGSSLSSYQDMRMKEAQIDNLTANNTVILQNALLKMAQTEKTQYDAAKSGTDVRMTEDSVAGNLYESMKLQQYEAMKSQVEKLNAGTKVMLDENERRAAMQSKNLQMAVERIMTMRLGRDLTSKQIDSITQDVELKRLSVELQKEGINASDPTWMRILARFLGKYGMFVR